MDVEFSIPLNKEDLLSNNSDGYSVKNIIEPASIDEKLEGIHVYCVRFSCFFVLHY